MGGGKNTFLGQEKIQTVLMAQWERKSEIWDAMTQLALIMEWVKDLLR